ncbi:MAG: hypothetical protein A3J24_07875 [Deltaproteobacteria bacterium RIFCSPLOWO2_02_FULL_53_8]|nr:MAG: hypothetical protein A3J24_07875 [Deltaproteobacteria bacterium RIFCSPLOWO2_02_FULL_53_8]
MGIKTLKELDIPLLPENAQKVLTLLADPNVSVEKVRRLVAYDGPLAAKILNIANFDFFGGSRVPPTLSDSIMRLGLNAVRNIVVASSVKGLFKRLGPGEQTIWRMMMGSAIAASIIARNTKLSDTEDAFIGGLLHDAGLVAVINSYPEVYQNIVSRAAQEGRSVADVCSDELGFSHRSAGAMMVKRWGFPDALESLIFNFDDAEIIVKERYLYNLVSIITLADKMCAKAGIVESASGQNNAWAGYGTLDETLGLDESDMNRILENVMVAFSRGLPLY